MLPAARITDSMVCAKHKVPPSPVSGGKIAPRVSAHPVRIGMLLAAREGDTVMCVGGGQETIVRGEPTVIIEGKPAARVTDPVGTQKQPTGKIVTGCLTVRIGSMAQATPLQRAAEKGTPFCEECEKEQRGAAGGSK